MINFKPKPCKSCEVVFIPRGNNQKYCDACAKEVKLISNRRNELKYRLNHPTEKRVRDSNYYQTHKEEKLARGNERRRLLRIKVLSHYANGTPKCACCGESHIQFLGIDHIDGNGGKHKATIKRPGNQFYSWLKKNNFPSGFRVLCHNCNLSLGFYGFCPHQQR